MYLHAYSASLLTAYRHCPLLTIGPGHVPARIPGRAGAGLPALPLVKRPLTCTCIRASASRCSTYRRCILLTIGSNYCRSSWRGAYRRCLLLIPSPSCVPAPILGGLAHRLPTLPPADNQPWMRTYTQASWRKLASVASSRQAALDIYLYTCFGELAQPLLALRLIDNRLRLMSGELA